jgi:hypothetical protein
MQFRFEENPSSTRAAGTAKTPIKGVEFSSDDRRSARVRKRRSRRGNQFPIYDLSDENIGNLQEILVCRSTLRRIHDRNTSTTAKGEKREKVAF